MSFKRILALLTSIVMCMACLPASADSSTEGQTLYYTGGVVMRTLPRDGDTANLLQLAYTMTDTPYIVLNQPYEWELIVSGGTEPYTMKAVLAWQESLDMDSSDDPWTGTAFLELTEPEIAYTFTESGRYFWQITVSDSAGQSLTFQTRPYEAYTAADETDSSTTVGKVNSIVASLITDGMSDYSRAKVLHDWLIYNANYDYTYTYYDASGVLVHGAGVCDSYARAYLMLCTAAGLECMYVSGTAGNDPDPDNWGNHGWNLVKLNGSWYHVDCTWDDPNEGGGYERHTYFCVDDETMAKDHRWNRPDDLFDNGGMLVPDAEGGEYESADGSLSDYDFQFTTWDEFGEELDAMVAAGDCRATTVGLYTGTLSPSEMYETMGEWAGTKANELAAKGMVTGAGYGYRGTLFFYYLTWNDPTSYMRIDESSVRLSVGETVTLYPSEFDPCSNVFTWSSSDANVAKASYVWDADAENPFALQVTGVAAGEATITVTSPDGITDSVSVTVLKPYAPDFDLTLTSSSGKVDLAWNGVPGATRYTVVRVFNSTESTLTTVAAAGASLSASQLPVNVQQQVYVVAERVVAGKTYASYTSKAVTYGENISLTYTAVLPSGTTTIGDSAFLNNTKLTAVSIPDGVTAIGSRAFAGCTGLFAVSIPDSVTSIGADAFEDCPLTYAEVVEDSYADSWMQKNCPDVMLIYCY